MRCCIYILVLVLSIGLVSAEVSLISPGDGQTLTKESQRFVFDFGNTVSADECNLYVDDEIKKTYRNVAHSTDISMTISLQSGEYNWYVQCLQDEEVFTSVTRAINVNLPAKEDVTDVKITSGGIGKGLLYSFDWYPNSNSQKDVYLEDLIIGDTLEFKINGDKKNTFLLFMILVTSGKDSPLIKFKTSLSNANTIVNEGDSYELDITGDDVADAFLKVEDISKISTIDIRLSAISGSYDDFVEDVEPVEEPVEEVVFEEDEVKEYNPFEEAEEEVEKEEETKDSLVDDVVIEEKGSSKAVFWLFIIVIVGLIAVAYMKVKRHELRVEVNKPKRVVRKKKVVKKKKIPKKVTKRKK